MNEFILKQINKAVADKLQERDQALNGWIAIDSAGITTASGSFCGIKVLAGATATVALTFATGSPCNVNGVTIDLLQGDYLPTPGCNSVTVSAGKVILIKAQQ